MRKSKSRTNPLKHFKMSSLRNVKTPEAWVKKESYTEEEINQQREANRILSIWDSTKDPDIIKRRAARLTITSTEISGHVKKAKMDTPFKIDLARNYISCLKRVSTPEAVASNGAAYTNYRYRKYGKVDNWIDSDWQEVAPESKINKGDYILWMTPTNR